MEHTNNLRKLRTERNMKQKDVCLELEKYQIHIDRTTYSKYETTARQPSADLLIGFALVFETSIDYILGITENPKPLR